jgi:acetyl-CoA/propionyl-CoA carboxylase carboxyl transferase subunit
MGPEGAVNIVFRHELERSDDKDAKRTELITEYEQKFANPYLAADRGYVDDVIDPSETRPRLIKALRMLETKREAVPGRKHGNIPL